MGETVEYSGHATGFKSVAEKEEFHALAEEFQDAEADSMNDGVYFYVQSGWRGGAMSCEEIVARHFSDWLEDHPNVTLQTDVRYVEHAPYDSFQLGAGGEQ